jgi:hypothetical protein
MIAQMIVGVGNQDVERDAPPQSGAIGATPGVPGKRRDIG